jgi:hypothetical protein
MTGEIFVWVLGEVEVLEIRWGCRGLNGEDIVAQRARGFVKVVVSRFRCAWEVLSRARLRNQTRLSLELSVLAGSKPVRVLLGPAHNCLDTPVPLIIAEVVGGREAMSARRTKSFFPTRLGLV